MTDNALLGIVLVSGGAIYLGVFLWVTTVRVREIESQDKANEHPQH